MGIAVNETSPKLFASKLNKIFRKMSSISAIVFIVFWAAFTLASTDKKVDVKMVDLAEELAQSRQDLATARQDLAKIIRKENTQLRQEDQKLKEQDEKLEEENGKLRQELTKLRHELHQANTDMKTTMRQKDQNITQELQKMMRQKDQKNTQELKKMMKDQIEEYLKENKLCVAGNFRKNTKSQEKQGPLWKSTAFSGWIDVDFKYTFPRVPTFTASLNSIQLGTPLDSDYKTVDNITSKPENKFKTPWANWELLQEHSDYNTLRVDQFNYPAKVTRSSAQCYIRSSKRWTFFKASWIACL